ncbi:DNA methylase [Mycobacterium phage Phanphagia]|uniref:DNA methylase n=1 Tax=Mycobacterium phage Phanphagia TaxID=2719206 RepID=A0A6G9LDS6_9CAUD|nr:DNA methylase [Mycobacterium phage Phanphagia]
MDLFSGHSVPYSETFPTSGMTRSGSLLPLPTSAHRTGVNGSSSLPLLPTPNAQDGNGGRYNSDGHQNTLPGTVRDLLPTPSAVDGERGPDFARASRDGSGGDDLVTLCAKSTRDGRWGKYAAAIVRWEAVAGPAPSPTEPNKNGNPRLAAAFPEWMMGWPAGWVTEVPGISRNDALRICGNGVCPQQAYAALQILVRVSAYEVVE